ncbi:aspartic proteinase nepenthesin-2-like [Pyrus ussuriensis x Pyrus communis]|uniref:Aspartic proteinase nepenthesin-2-like n=1 Tax=Pyrus ussuriensis x Pyrus communis TaxID=2448454 RepID=A0A5N5FQ52_9ROSA|nr:aspartic proteinase nepenthesin-2-like [Pyrus ussuriensis x Pyrus communis]
MAVRGSILVVLLVIFSSTLAAIAGFTATTITTQMPPLSPSETSSEFKPSTQESSRKRTRTQFQGCRKTRSRSPTIKSGCGPCSLTGVLHQRASGQLQATLKSGVSLGSGEYFMDVFIGTPPKHFSLILDTGSDLNWVQCAPCHDCFEQQGPHYDPKDSTSFLDISCKDPRCRLVSSPDPAQSCKSENQTCPYFYWYGDSSNTTGDFSLETFTVENVMFGCGHWNRGLFHGAAGLLGLGRGPLSFASQLQSLYGHSFSYCLVDRNSDANVSSKLIFGEDKNLLSHPKLSYTSLVGGKENPADTFYYVEIKSVMVGGEAGAGGTIIDSGSTLSYFADPAYQMIKEAFEKKVKGYPVVNDFPILKPCYNVSGVEKIELPEFAILFADGAVWDFPVENYFIQIEPQEMVCLAVLGTPKSSLSIIGNYQQQNFHSSMTQRSPG